MIKKEQVKNWILKEEKLEKKLKERINLKKYILSGNLIKKIIIKFFSIYLQSLWFIVMSAKEETKKLSKKLKL